MGRCEMDELIKAISGKVIPFDDKRVGLCSSVAWTIPDFLGTMLCDLPARHVGDHAMGIPGGYRSWPKNQTEPLPMQ
jgi:hypothetical protein